MKKIQVTVTRTDEYIIEVDENIYNDEWRKEFEQHFWDLPDHTKLAECLAKYQARNGEEDGFIEGFGYVKRNGELPFSNKDFNSKGKLKPKAQRRKEAKGLNIIIVDEDEDIDVESTVIE